MTPLRMRALHMGTLPHPFHLAGTNHAQPLSLAVAKIGGLWCDLVVPDVGTTPNNTSQGRKTGATSFSTPPGH